MLRSAIMNRSQLKVEANKTRKVADILNHKKQRHLVVKKKIMNAREYFDELNLKPTTKPFWKTCKLYFSNIH